MQPVRPPSRAASYSKQHDEESGLKAEYIPNLLLTRPELVKTISGNNVIPQIAPSVDIISKTYQPASNQLLKKPSLVNLTPYLIQPQPQTARKPAKRHSQLRPAVNLDGPYVPTPDQYNQTLPHQRPQNVQKQDNQAWEMASKVTTKMLSGLDYVGEGLADAMGITSPRFNSQETNKGVNNHIHQTQIVSSSQPYSYYQQKSANGMYNSRQNFKATAYNELVNDVAKGLGISKKADELSQIV